MKEKIEKNRKSVISQINSTDRVCHPYMKTGQNYFSSTKREASTLYSHIQEIESRNYDPYLTRVGFMKDGSLDRPRMSKFEHIIQISKHSSLDSENFVPKE